LRRRRAILARAAALAPLLGAAGGAAPASAQAPQPDPLRRRLDEDRFLRGLTELQLPEVLEHYLAANPPADPVEAAERQIALQRLRLESGPMSAAARREILDRVYQVRARLIETEPDDPRCAIWITDQAALVLLDLWPLDAAGLTSLCGAPTDGQLETARRLIRDLHQLTAGAEAAVGRAVVALEESPAFASDSGLRLLHRRLVEEERDLRIRFLRGAAMVLQAELAAATDRDRRAGFEGGLRLLDELPERLAGPMAARARLYRGLALCGLGETERAQAMLQSVVEDAAVHPHDAFVARTNEIRLQQRGWGAQAALDRLAAVRKAYQGPDQFLYRLLLADQEHALRRELATRGGEGAAGHAQAAFAAYADLLGSGGELPIDVVRALVLERMTRVVHEGLDPDAFPPLVTLALAARLAGDGAPDRALRMYEQAAGRRDASEEDRALALFGSGRTLHELGREAEAAAAFTRFAREHPRLPEAERAVELGAALAARVWERAPGDAVVAEQLREALELLLSRYPNLASVDRWRHFAGRVAQVQGRLEDARELFAQVPRDAREWFDARFQLAALARTAALAAQGEAERAAWRSARDECARARADLAEALPRLPEGEAGEVRASLAWLRVHQAEAHVALHEAALALEVLEGIETEAGIEGPVLAAALRARIDAFQMAGDGSGARDAVARFVRAAPQRAGEVVPPLMAEVQGEVERLLREGQEEEAAGLARLELLPLAEILDAWLAEGPEGDVTAPRSRTADGFRLAGRFADGLRQYDRLLEDHPDALQFVTGRAECLYGMGDEASLAAAMPAFKRIAALGSQDGGEAYWLAQLRQLQILDRVGRNTAKIGPQIERLRQDDPLMGGERFRRQFDALQARHR
jgi:tetratricopeptide (TPR) repeat protein